MTRHRSATETSRWLLNLSCNVLITCLTITASNILSCNIPIENLLKEIANTINNTLKRPLWLVHILHVSYEYVDHQSSKHQAILWLSLHPLFFAESVFYFLNSLLEFLGNSLTLRND